MNVKGIAMLGLAAVFAVPAGWSQTPTAQGWSGGGPSDQYIEHQQQQLEPQVHKRVADIEKRFAEEQAFRIKMKDQRVEFERKLGRERKAFLTSLKSMKPEDRRKAADGFYNGLRDKRKEYGEQRRAESHKFWDVRIPQRQMVGQASAGLRPALAR